MEDGDKLPKDPNELELPADVAEERIKKLTKQKEAEERKKKLGLEFDIGELLDYDYNQDPNRLLGEKRWICKGSHCLWIGATGVGKSSLCGQMGILWSIGKDLFGIAPVSPLVCVLGQAEDDKGDLAEITQGIINGFSLQDRREEIRSRFKIHRVRARGEKLRAWCETVCQEYAPDVIFINPLNKFSEGSLSKEEDAQKLVDLFDYISDKYGVSFHVFHHTPKPQILKEGQKQIDMSYLGFGSSVIPDWARAIMVLSKAEDERFILTAAKRGGRAGLRTIKGQFTKEIYLRQGEHSIFWERDTGVSTEGDVKALVLLLSVDKWTSESEIKLGLKNNSGFSAQEINAHYSKIVTTLHLEDMHDMDQQREFLEEGISVKCIKKQLYYKLRKPDEKTKT